MSVSSDFFAQPVDESTIFTLAGDFASADPSRYGPVPIWWWSGARLDRARIRWQMEQMVSHGIAQAVVMNLAPAGPLQGALADEPAFMSPEWWNFFEDACQDASELGLRLWLYDQIGFSGANFQGQLVSKQPAWAGQSLEFTEQELSNDSGDLSLPFGATALGAYVVNSDGRCHAVPVLGGSVSYDREDQRLVLVYATEKGFDYFNKTACLELIDTIHGESQRRVGRWFGTTIPGFFQDEMPNIPTWGPSFRESFIAAFGYDLVACLPALLGDAEDDVIIGDLTVSAHKVRADFHAHRANESNAAFFDPLAAWFKHAGLICGFDQQSPAREGDPSGSVRLYGDYLEVHSRYGAPGSDHWGDSKLHSSLSQANGNTRTWIEAFHSSGWGGTLEETYDWLSPFLRRGANLYDPHAIYYATPGAWWEWAPPSTCWRQPYWPQYKILSHSISRLSELFIKTALVADTLMLFPTVDAQSRETLRGPLDNTSTESSIYHELNGVPTWYREKKGVLESAGFDYNTFAEQIIDAGAVLGSSLLAGGGEYFNVVIPGCTAIDVKTAALLAEFARSGGTVVCAGKAPTVFLGAEVEDPRTIEFQEAIDRGAILVVPDVAEVPAHLRRGPVWVESVAPNVLRKIGDSWVIGLFAHDDVSGTKQPIIEGTTWPRHSRSENPDPFYPDYWEQASTKGYRFAPVSGRVEHLTVHGVGGGTLQRWDPRTGAREEISFLTDEEGTITVDVAFDHGSVLVLVLGDSLPAAESHLLTESIRSIDLTSWKIHATSTVDNTWGDSADRSRPGRIPIEVWNVEVAAGAAPREDSWTPACASFGPFGEICGPIDGGADASNPQWKRTEWSLSRGIYKDKVHGPTLGPNGYVPEEFVAWQADVPGSRFGFRSHIDVHESDENIWIVLGSSADCELRLSGEEVELSGDGYWHTGRIRPGKAMPIEVWLTTLDTLEPRLSFAIVNDLSEYFRPEWAIAADEPLRDSAVEMSLFFVVTGSEADHRVQVGTEQRSTVLINGVELGRHGAFDPYEGKRLARIHPYDLAPHLAAGVNTLTVLSTDAGRPVVCWVDSVSRDHGGLGVYSGSGNWSVSRDGQAIEMRVRRQRSGDVRAPDPRYACLVPRPHPLPRAEWLEPQQPALHVVADTIPDLDPSDSGSRWLRFTLPAGAIRFRVPTELEFTAQIDSVAVPVVGNEVELPHPGGIGAKAALEFVGRDGRRGGALLERGIEVDVEEVDGALVDWSELGLESMGGVVAYRTPIKNLPVTSGDRVLLDLGRVRGSVEVWIDDELVGEMAWSPYTIDISEVLARHPSHGDLRVLVRNTIAGYMTAVSPSPGIFAGQTSAGLFGPVTISVRRTLALSAPTVRPGR